MNTRKNNILKSELNFGNSAIKALFFTSLFTMFAEYITSISSMLIVGIFAGENSLCAVELLSPLYNYGTFLSEIICVGSGLIYFRFLGSYDKDRSNEIFGQAIILSVGIGILMFAVLFIAQDAFLDSLNVSEVIRSEAEAFLKYQKLGIAILPINFLLFDLLYTDTRIATIANIVLMVTSIGASVILTNLYGAEGASLGMVTGDVFSTLILCLHFLKKDNIISFKWHFSLKDIKEIIKLSLVDSSKYLNSGLLIMFINFYVVKYYSEEMLPVVAVMVVVINLTVVFDCVGMALQPVAEVYLGEGNNLEEKNAAGFSLKMSIVFGLIAAAVCYILAPLFPVFTGISDSESIADSVVAIHLFAPSMIFFSIAYMMISQYVIVRKIPLAVAYEWVKNPILPMLFILIFEKAFGFNGIWVAFVPAEIAAVFGFAAAVCLFSGKERSIWFLEDSRYPLFSRSYYVSEKSAITARDDIELFLNENRISQKIISRIILSVEEMTMLLQSINPDKKVIVQYSVFIEDEFICVYERDNGNAYDLSDPNMEIGSLRHFVFSCMIDECDHKQYLMTIDYNRNIFKYNL